MAEQGRQPQRYSIDGLLNTGVQPFDDLDDDTLEALGKGLRREESMAVLVVITRDGILIDGHQRLRALRAKGRKFLDARDVRVHDSATRDNALEWAVRLNAQRRHLSVEQKASVARRLQTERGWSQRKIADLFGVSRPAVSQWLARTDPDATLPAPETVTGIDGSVQTVGHKHRTPATVVPAPWSERGYRLNQVIKLKRMIHPDDDLGELDRLDDEAREVVKVHLEDLLHRIETLLDHLTDDPRQPVG